MSRVVAPKFHVIAKSKTEEIHYFSLLDPRQSKSVFLYSILHGQDNVWSKEVHVTYVKSLSYLCLVPPNIGYYAAKFYKVYVKAMERYYAYDKKVGKLSPIHEVGHPVSLKKLEALFTVVQIKRYPW